MNELNYPHVFWHIYIGQTKTQSEERLEEQILAVFWLFDDILKYLLPFWEEHEFQHFRLEIFLIQLIIPTQEVIDKLKDNFLTF